MYSIIGWGRPLGILCDVIRQRKGLGPLMLSSSFGGFRASNHYCSCKPGMLVIERGRGQTWLSDLGS